MTACLSKNTACCFGGRLFCRKAAGMTRSHAPSTAGCIFSDDQGNIWRAGVLAQDACIVNGNETAVAQLPDGRLLLNHGNMNADRHPVLSISADGTGLEKIWRCEELPDPMCFGGRTAGKEGILFSKCVRRERREHAAVQYSGDTGGALAGNQARGFHGRLYGHCLREGPYIRFL